MTKTHIIYALVAAATWQVAADDAQSARAGNFRPPPGWVRTAHVHDPSVFKDLDGKFRIFGTHLASAASDNLISWRQTDSLRRAVSPETAEKIRAWNKDGTARNWFDYLWAPDVVYNRKMRKYCVYLSANGDDWKSNIVLLTADRAEGPYEYAGSVVYGGFSPADWKETDVPAVLGAKTLPERYVTFGVGNKKGSSANCRKPFCPAATHPNTAGHFGKPRCRVGTPPLPGCIRRSALQPIIP